MSYEKKKNILLNRYPAICDLASRAKKRMPKVAREYLEAGTGNETLISRNRSVFNEVVLTPRFCKGPLNPNLETSIFSQTYAAPFGIAPVGLTGLMWPKAEIYLAEAAKAYNIPFTLSTLATETPERLSEYVGDTGWFQLYVPREFDICKKLLDRARDAGFHTLVITADVPIPSRRERTKRAGLTTPPKITAGFVWQGITHPSWTLATLRNGLPKLRTVADYSDFRSMMSVGEFVSGQMGGNLTWEYCQEIKEAWEGPVVIKGLLHPRDAEEAVKAGMDGIVVSNHGGRQFDAAPSSLEMLPEVAKAANGRIPILFDSGVRTGLDILKALSLGADFVLLGRAFMYGLSALGRIGPMHVIKILEDDLKNNMMQLGIEDLQSLKHLDD